MNSKDKIWDIKNRKAVFESKIFSIYEMDCYLASKNIHNNFYAMKLHDWVNIFAYTEEGNVILVRQHRLGSDIVTVEVPAGAMEKGEDPKEAAIRELEEETGYEAKEMILLKKIRVNPAIQDNYCYFFLAKDCKQSKNINFDPTEELESLIKPINEVFDSILNSSMIDNSLALMSVMFAKEYMSKNKIIF